MKKGSNFVRSTLLDLQNGREMWENYNNKIKFNIQQLQKEIIEDKNKTIATTDVCAVVDTQ